MAEAARPAGEELSDGEWVRTGTSAQLPREKFYIPGSLLKTNIDNTNPLAYGMPEQVDVFFDNSPVFRLEPNAELKKTSPVAWFSGTAGAR